MEFNRYAWQARERWSLHLPDSCWRVCADQEDVALEVRYYLKLIKNPANCGVFCYNNGSRLIFSEIWAYLFVILCIMNIEIISHPFSCIEKDKLSRIFIVLGVLTLILMFTLNSINSQLSNKTAPMGIVSFELAGTLENSQNIMAGWGEDGKTYAALSLGLDYLFLVAYASFLSLGCLLVTNKLTNTGKLIITGILLSWSQFLAGFLDGIENWALIQLLFHSQNEFYPMLAKYCAIPKFVIIGCGILYIVTMLLFSLLSNLIKKETSS